MNRPPAPASPTAPAASDDAFSFAVNDFEFSGTLSDTDRERVNAFVAPWRGRTVTLGQLQALRDELTLVLYNDGESLVRVVLPPQTVEVGRVRFDVVRGYIESIEVSNESRVSTERLEAILQSTRETTPILRDIERNARLVEGIPGVEVVSSMLSAGTKPGATIVDVNVAPADRFYAAATLDNSGSRYAGWRRLGLSGGVNNLLGQGDELQANVFVTPRFMQTRAGEDGRTRLGRLSYDALTGMGASRAGIAYAHVDYRLGGDFSGLGTGNADVVSLYGTNPVIRSANARFDLGASIEARRSKDERFEHVLESEQRGMSVSMRADGSYLSGLGGRRNLSRYGAVATVGATRQSEFDNTDTPSIVARRRFDFAKLEPSFAVTQSLPASLQFNLALRGQWASRALDSSQRLGLGGPSSVRAYDQNAAAVDDGIIGTVSVSKLIGALPGAAVQVFYDGARGKMRGDGMLPGASVSLQGFGVGASYSNKYVSAQISYALRAGHSLEHTARQQTWVTLTAMV